MTQADEAAEQNAGGMSFWKVMFPLLSFCSAAISFAACSEWAGLEADTRGLALRIFILVLGCVLAAYVSGEGDFPPRLILLMLPVGTAAALFVTRGEQMPGFASVVFYALVILVAMVVADESRARTEKSSTRQGVIYAWAICGTLLFAASWEPVAHPWPRLPDWMIPNAVQDFVYTYAMDLRAILSVLAGTFLLGTAISRTVAERPVPIPDIPHARLTGLSLSGWSGRIIHPVLRAAVTVWTIVRVPANVVWRFAAHSAATLTRIAWHCLRLIAAELLDPSKLVRIVGQVVLWLILLALVRGSGTAAHVLLDYLREVPGTRSAIAQLVTFFVAGLVGTMLFIRMLMFLFDEPDAESIVSRAAECASTFLLIFATASVVMHAAARVPMLRIEGFTGVGPVTGYVLAVFAVVIVALIFRTMRERRVPQGG